MACDTIFFDYYKYGVLALHSHSRWNRDYSNSANGYPNCNSQWIIFLFWIRSFFNLLNCFYSFHYKVSLLKFFTKIIKWFSYFSSFPFYLYQRLLVQFLPKALFIISRHWLHFSFYRRYIFRRVFWVFRNVITYWFQNVSFSIIFSLFL